MNKLLIEKFVAIEHAMAQEKGSTKLLALLEPEDSQGEWDMLLSADWVQGSTLEALDFVLAKMKTVLEPPEYYQFKITLLRSNEPLVHAFQQFLDDNPQQRKFSNIEILGLAIKQAYLIVPWIETPEDQLQKIKSVVDDLQLLKEVYKILAEEHQRLKLIMWIALQNPKLLEMSSHMELLSLRRLSALLEMPNNLKLPPPGPPFTEGGIKDN